MSYRKLLTGQLTCAIFDLDKNEHQFIKICEAPSLVLFERTNKKAAIIYRGIEVTVDSLRKWLNNQMTHLVIPEDSVP